MPPRSAGSLSSHGQPGTTTGHAKARPVQRPAILVIMSGPRQATLPQARSGLFREISNSCHPATVLSTQSRSARRRGNPKPDDGLSGPSPATPRHYRSCPGGFESYRMLFGLSTPWLPPSHPSEDGTFAHSRKVLAAPRTGSWTPVLPDSGACPLVAPNLEGGARQHLPLPSFPSRPAAGDSALALRDHSAQPEAAIEIAAQRPSPPTSEGQPPASPTAFRTPPAADQNRSGRSPDPG